MRPLIPILLWALACTGSPADTDSRQDVDDCATDPTAECDEACLALEETACVDDPTCLPYYGDRLADGCIQRGRFAACRHFDWDVAIDVDNWAQRGPDGACWLFDPGQSHPTFVSGCSYADDFEGVADCP